MAKKKPNRTNERVLQVRITDAQLEEYQSAADNDDRTLSNWVRSRLDKAAKRELKK